MSDFLTVDPIRMFEIQGQAYRIMSQPITLSSGNNQQVIAGASGYVIRIMGICGITSPNAEASITLKDGSGGTTLIDSLIAPYGGTGTDNPGNGLFNLPLVYCGYCQTTSGTGLYADVATAAIRGTIFYLKFLG